ncbi:MAG: hypothetical protein ABI597_07755 [Gammaproteobacteria bacterium]
MSFKKYLVLGSTVIALSFPIIASADLDVYNYTDKPSSVKITNSKFQSCSDKSTPAYNPNTKQPGHIASTPQAGVKFICQKLSGICTADMYASSNCKGTKVAELSINLDNLVVTVTKPYPNYKVEIISLGFLNTQVNIKPVA